MAGWADAHGPGPAVPARPVGVVSRLWPCGWNYCVESNGREPWGVTEWVTFASWLSLRWIGSATRTRMLRR
jgi:hypothetical protein